METTNTDIDLTAFSKPDASRDFLKRPFVKSGKFIGTNGMICIRLDTDQPDTPTPKEDPTDSIFKSAKPIDPIPWPVNTELIDSGIGHDCRTCEGSGHEIAGKCSACDGTGFDSENDDCEYCDGNGLAFAPTPCPTCNGTTRKLIREVAGAFIDRHFERWILVFPNVQVIGLIEAKSSNPSWITGLIFKFDGGDGAIMGIDRREKR